ncbi:MAG: SpoIIE family protein phosphatase [Calditrichaceae bacterium]|nr:SpoIIE family protein phosphatase [Calditrichia bacterium]NUQ39995.1 SpoIIE family protein phosphatase [Calditrichaceae bacterium]
MFKNISKEEIVVPASMAHLKEIRDFIEQIGKKYKISDKIINSFKLVVDEACTNIIRHGYKDIKDGKITIRAIIRRLSVTIVVIDQGRSFDPRQVKDPDLQKYVQIGKKGGLGIHMMRKLMDDIQYNITGHGNELRLAKTREAVEESKYLSWFGSLSLRNKSFMVTSIIMVVLTLAAYFLLKAGIEADVREKVFAEATSISNDFARVNYEPLRQEKDTQLFENAKSIQQSRSEMLRMVMILKQNLEVIAFYPINLEMVPQSMRFDNLKTTATFEDVTVYQTAMTDSGMVYYFVSPIQLSIDPAPIGYTLLGIEEVYIHHLVIKQKNRLIFILLLVFALGTAGIALLVTLITKPFHKLAEWVRQVGRGQVDQDEIDIDASDEVGEIAQAFSEVTNKFREAQISVIEQQRMQKELQVAQEIQQMLLPDDFPDVVGYDIASYYQSAKEVGGDLFDFMEIDDQSIGICVADVSGKGVPGSLVMTMIRTSLRLESRGNDNAADIMTRVNAFVTDDIRKGMFVTMLYVILDSRERMVSFASAGHNPMILYRGKSKETYYLNPSGFPVGITLPDIRLFGEKIQADRIRLHPDDIFILYTDGVTEAMNPQRDLYGEERFLAAIRKYGHLDVEEFVRSIKEDILAFTGGFEQNDDITLVAIKENMAAVDVKVNTFKKLFEQVQADNNQSVADTCKEVGVSPTTFYRYKRIYQEGGYDLLREMLHGYTNLGLRHLSIEVKTKMYDIIRQYPEFGPKKISDMLNTEKYAYTEISPFLVYEELRRAKLNTKEQRLAFVQRGGKKRLKPPGTPLLTLDGEVMVGFRSDDQKTAEMPFMPNLPPTKSRAKEKMISARGKRIPGAFPSEPSNQKPVAAQEGAAGENDFEEPVEEDAESKVDIVGDEETEK